MRTAIIALLFCFCSAALAQLTPTQGATAGDMALACTLKNGKDAEQARYLYMCLLPIKGFTDGYKRGVANGVRTSFLSDSANLATIQGIDNAQIRTGLARKKAECMPPVATIEQIAEVFVHYIEAHPTTAGAAYATPLGDAIEGYFCPP
jgi:hypothetical protein